MMDEKTQHKLLSCQTQIIKLQGDVIDELFQLLCEYMDAEELASLPAINKISEAISIDKSKS